MGMKYTYRQTAEALMKRLEEKLSIIVSPNWHVLFTDQSM